MIPERTWARIELALASQTPIYLQRLPHLISASELAERCIAQGWAARLVDSPFEQASLRILDCRGKNQEWFEEGDARREAIVAAGQIVILLDAHASDLLQQNAPHLTSWAGGIWLPGESGVVSVWTDDEFAMGENLLERELKNQDLAPKGEVAIDLATRKIFKPCGESTAFERAQEVLDEGLIFRAWFGR